jgi:hypothetical protein
MDDLGDVRMWDAAQERYAPAVTGRGLRMDVEKARGVVRELESLADQVVELSSTVQPFGIVPAGADDVSVNVAEQSAAMMVRGRDFLRAWHGELRTGIAALREQIDSYEALDQRNIART